MKKGDRVFVRFEGQAGGWAVISTVGVTSAQFKVGRGAESFTTSAPKGWYKQTAPDTWEIELRGLSVSP